MDMHTHSYKLESIDYTFTQDEITDIIQEHLLSKHDRPLPTGWVSRSIEFQPTTRLDRPGPNSPITYSTDLLITYQYKTEVGEGGIVS